MKAQEIRWGRLPVTFARGAGGCVATSVGLPGVSGFGLTRSEALQDFREAATRVLTAVAPAAKPAAPAPAAKPAAKGKA